MSKAERNPAAHRHYRRKKIFAYKNKQNENIEFEKCKNKHQILEEKDEEGE